MPGRNEMKRAIILVTLVAIALGVAAYFLPVDFLRAPIERALERGLGRRVEIGEIHFNLFTGPGFTIDSVTIHEDLRAGIEPFAYVDTLEARVRVLSLFFRRLEFSSLRLGDATINLVKTDAGPWNFQFLLGASANSFAMPAIRMRGGRVNFKFGDTKSVLYFNDADFDVSPAGDGSVELRFSGAPSRTDRSAQDFGHFFVRGEWTGQQWDMKVELERSALADLAQLLNSRDFGLHGIVALEAELSGPPSHLAVTGQLQIDDVHRWDLLPQRGGWRIGYTGTLDLHGERLELASTSDIPNPPLTMRFRAWDFLSTPHWDASAGVNQVPLATLIEVARHMGAAMPQKVAAEGAVSGAVAYSEAEGLVGRLEMQDAVFTVPDAQALRAANASVVIDRQAVSLEPATVRIGENESAEVEGRYTLSDSAPAEARPGPDRGGSDKVGSDKNAPNKVSDTGLNLKVTTRSLSVADTRSFGLAAIPLFDKVSDNASEPATDPASVHSSQGTWRGTVRYHWAPPVTGDEHGEWSGEYELQNARVAVEGLADPVRIQSAAVSLNGPRIAVTRLRAKAGSIAFTGEYHWDPKAIRPHLFRIAIPEADAAELVRLWTPALVRERGFLARTLRLSPEPLPDWLKGRRADGTLSVGSLNFGDSHFKIDGARLLWDGAAVRLLHARARLDQASLNAEIAVDLSGRAPHYHAVGKLADFAYAGGKLDFEGSLEGDVLGLARAEGSLRGRAIAFAPDADFRSVTGCFEMITAPAGPRWKLTELEVVEGGEAYYGTGATQPDGRLALELLGHGRQLHVSSGPPVVASQ
jgi:AsmA protein